MDYSLQDLGFDLLVVLFAYVYVIITIFIPLILKKKDKISKFTARKAVHLLAGLTVLTAPFYIWPFWPTIIAGSLTILVYFSRKDSKVKQLQDLYDAIGEEEEDKLAKPFLQGPFFYCLSITSLITIFAFLAPDQMYFPIAGILIMIISDTLASVVGKRWGKYHIQFPWSGRRSIIGSSTMFLTAFILSLGSFWYFGYYNPLTQIPLTWNLIIIYAILTAITATIVEILSPSTWDDLTVPTASTLVIFLLATFISF